jgi:hypothetical protein
MNAMSVMGMDFAAMSLKTKLLFCCWLMRISLFRLLHMDCLLAFNGLMRPARLLRDVPEKADAFLRWALCAASYELLISVAICAWFAAPDRRKASAFSDPSQSGYGLLARRYVL